MPAVSFMTTPQQSTSEILSSLDSLSRELTALSSSFETGGVNNSSKSNTEAPSDERSVDFSTELDFSSDDSFESSDIASDLRIDLASHLIPSAEIDAPVVELEIPNMDDSGVGVAQPLSTDDPDSHVNIGEQPSSTILGVESVARSAELLGTSTPFPTHTVHTPSFELAYANPVDVHMSINPPIEPLDTSDQSERVDSSENTIGHIEYNYSRNRNVDPAKLIPKVDTTAQVRIKPRATKTVDQNPSTSSTLIPKVDLTSNHPTSHSLFKASFKLGFSSILITSVASNLFFAPYLLSNSGNLLHESVQSWVSLLSSQVESAKDTPLGPAVTGPTQVDVGRYSEPSDAPSNSPSNDQPQISDEQVESSSEKKGVNDTPSDNTAPVANTTNQITPLPDPVVTSPAPKKLDPKPLEKSSLDKSFQVTRPQDRVEVPQQLSCLRWSDLNDDTSSALKLSLKSKKILFSSTETQTPLFYVVAIDPSNAPKAYISELQERGIQSFRIKEEGPFYGFFSLGQFKSESGALRHKRDLESKGVGFLVTGGYKTIKSNTVTTLNPIADGNSLSPVSAKRVDCSG